MAVSPARPTWLGTAWNAVKGKGVFVLLALFLCYFGFVEYGRRTRLDLPSPSAAPTLHEAAAPVAAPLIETGAASQRTSNNFTARILEEAPRSIATLHDALRYFLDGSPIQLGRCRASDVEASFRESLREPSKPGQQFVKAPWCLAANHDTAEFGSNVDTFLCVANTSYPPFPFVSRGKKKLKMKLFDQGCGAKYPLSDARPGANRSYMWVQDEAKLTPRTGVSVAVLLSGQFRRVSVAGPSQYTHLVAPNRAHVYVATWPFPEDTTAPDASGAYLVPRLQNLYHDNLAAARVEMFGPRMVPSRRYGILNTAFMFFLIEAAARMAIANPTQSYHFFVRCRLDMVLEHSVRILSTHAAVAVASPTGLSDGAAASGGGGQEPPSASTTPATENTRSSLAKGATALLNATWQLNFGQGTRNVPVNTIVVPSFTWCCMNDWFAVGHVTALAPYSFLYSLIAMNSSALTVDLVPFGGLPAKNVSASAAAPLPGNATERCAKERRVHGASCEENPREPLDLGFQRGQTCSAERCVAKLLIDAGIAWALADLPGTILSDRRIDTSRSAPGCPKDCPKLR